MTDAPSQFTLTQPGSRNVALSPACQRELSRHPKASHAEILRHARSLADEDGRTLMAQDIQTAVRLLAAPPASVSVNRQATPTPPTMESIPMRPGRRPLMSFKTCIWALYRNEDYILALIGDRKLIAFNIGGHQSSQCLPIIWTRSLVDFLASRPPTRATDEEIFADIFSGAQNSFRASELARLFTVSNVHIHRLIEAGDLAVDPSRPVTPGSSQSPYITRASLHAWLKTRRLS